MSKSIAPIAVKTAKPRNPFVAAMRQRHAGAHRAGQGALRRRAQRLLRRELDGLRNLEP